MDLHLSNSTLKNTEPESETPTRILPVKALSFTNGVLKRHPPLHTHHHHPVVVTYKECLKNHAAAMGGHALDGCGEFMPPSPITTTDPTSLKCAACGCHRNFHRREPDAPPPQLLLPSPISTTPALEYQPQNRHHPPPPPPPPQPTRGDDSESSPNSSPSPPPISSSYYHPSAPHMLLSLSHHGGLSAPPSLDGSPPIYGTPVGNSSNSSRKRHRTRFSHEQKQKMLEFSERLGWKMQKKDDDVINKFCGEIGVERMVFKVWMHNNKNNYGKKDQINDGVLSTPPAAAAAAATVNGNGVNYGPIGYPHEGNGVNKQETIQLHLHDNSSSAQVVGTNGSSSSC